MIKTLHVSILGRVQSVGYRAWTAGRARKLGIHGWVRNRRDGTVEAVFSGPEEAVDALVKECWEGPLAAKVIQVKAMPCEETISEGFMQRETI